MPAGTAGFSAQRLDRIRTRLQEDIDAKLIPGAAWLVARDGEVACEEAIGIQDPATGAPLTRETIFRIYSMTKPIVSIAIMMLAEQGKLLLSDSITKTLPEFRGVKVGAESQDVNGKPMLALEATRQPITVHDLLRHTSGLTYGIFNDSLVKAEYRKAGVGSWEDSSDEFIRKLASVPLAYQPGTVWEYSHATDALGVIVERVSGMPLDAFLEKHILHPLGMFETGFWVKPEQMHRVAQAFDVDPVTGAKVRLSKVDERPAFLSGGGGMLSTMRDYLRFAQMLLNEGELDGVRIISRTMLRYMASDHLVELPLAKSGQAFLPGPGYGFGLGFAVRTTEGAAITPGSLGDYTWSGLAGTYFWIDPRENMLAIYMMQAPEQRNPYRQMFRNLVYAALE
ncbi:class A beta-lactamase-related serine hydrolase [Oxalobacteraceae bacterium OM1]|nr:class A beta-lactamase-related serine hydrolase [Oxalobacteraceae bacterium OM1]